MKLSQILIISLVVTATLLTSAIDYTIKYGLVIHEKYIILTLISIVVTSIMIYYKKRIKKKSMMTFGLRFRFNISDKGTIRGDDKEIEFTLPNGHTATMKCIDAVKFSDSTKFDIRSGGYGTEEQALEYANKLKDAALYFGVKFSLGLDVGKDKASGGITKYFQNEIFNKKGVKTFYEVHGITTYSEEHPTSFISMSAHAIGNAKESKLFTEKVCNILSTPNQVDSKTKLAMELLASSYFESSPRAKFLTLVLAAESILTYENRSLGVKNLIDKLKEQMEASDITDKEKDSIRGSLRWLYRDSISQSLRKMAIIYLPEKVYDGMSAENFIKKCYNARSTLVHTGSLDDSKYNIGSLASNLKVYMTDMLTTISDI